MTTATTADRGSSDWAFDTLLRDGAVMRVRKPSSDDLDAARDFFASLSPRSTTFRFFTAHRLNEDELRKYALAEPANTEGLLAEIDGDLVGVATYVVTEDGRSADAAFAVADIHHHRGVGTLLLEHLAARARRAGISTFTAMTLPENKAMLNVFRSSGFESHRTRDLDVWELELDLTMDADAVAQMARREHVSESESVRSVLCPAAVAIVGASNEAGSVGHALFENLLDARFTGSLYPVNPNARSVHGVPAFASVEDIPGPIDLAVVAVPSRHVDSVIDQCGRIGAAAAVIITAGFAETGPAGLEAEERVLATARRHGMRIIGPNCIGVINTAEDIRMDATFSPVDPMGPRRSGPRQRGSVGFASQSGAMGIAALAETRDHGIGVSTFVSLGNKADVSSNDLLQYWEDDPGTDVIALYLESFGNPAKFSRIARRVSLTKPIVAMKSGRTEAGRRAASSHTAAMSSDDDLTEALFAEAGIVRVDTMAELFDVTRLLVHQPVPAGPRVAIIGNSGGPGILAADACANSGLMVPELAAHTQQAITELLPVGAGVSNPVDLIASARGDVYQTALEAVLADDGVDAVIVIYTDPMVSEASDVSAGVARAVEQHPGKPVVAAFLAADVGPLIHVEDDEGPVRAAVPVFDFPEAAAVALGHAAWLGGWRARPMGSRATLTDTDPLTARAIAEQALTDGATPGDAARGTWLDPEETARLLRCHGIDLVQSIPVRSADQAASAAAALDGPVALKVVSETILHKSDVGGVALDVDPARASATYRDFESRFGSEMSGALIQPMAPPGVEVIVGLLHDPTFGPAIMFGTGGVQAELWGDRAHALVPVTEQRAAQLINEPLGSALLRGYRGSTSVDLDALEQLVVRLSALAEDVPAISELDLNPVIATPTGCWIVDARCRVFRPPTQPDTDIRALRPGPRS